jgi:hypothetical protein
MFRIYMVFLFAAILLSACEKNITIDAQSAEPLLVVEATIENNEPPVVILSRSLNYFGKLSPQDLFNSFVRGATVDVSNGTHTHRLKEYTVPLGGGYSLSYYSIDSANLSTAFTGEFNKQYRLNISAEGKSYFATTNIPTITRRIDSLWWKPVPQSPDTNWVAVMVKAYDKPGLGDYIRYFTKRNREDFLPGEPSVFDDDVIDGTTYELQVGRGQDRNNPSTDGDYRYFFRRGDTITFKISQIDKATYDFWRTMEFTYQSIGNPFSSPVKVLSNIQGNKALGYFGGYATQYRTLIVPR